MSLQEVFSNWWQTLFLAPLGYIGVKFVSLNAKVSVHDSEIQTLKKTCENLCQSQQETNKLLSEISGTLKEHLRK